MRFQAPCAVLAVFLFMGLALVPLVATGSGSFSDDLVVNSVDMGDQRDPDIAVGGNGTISVIWRSQYDPGRTGIYHSRSVDNGTTFSDQIKVDEAASLAADNSPRIAAGEGETIYVVWADIRNGTSQIYLSRSTDGVHFSQGIPVSPSGQDQVQPDVAYSNGTVYVVWAGYSGLDHDIHLSRSTDGGGSFSPPIRVGDTGDASSIQNFPRVAAMNDTVFVVWHDTRLDPLLDVYGSLSHDSGETFGSDIKISDGPISTEQGYPVASFLPGGVPCVAWQDKRSGDIDIRFARSDGSEGFLPSVPVSDGPVGTMQTAPTMSVDSEGNVSIAFSDDRLGGSHVFYALSRDLGQSFTPDMRADEVIGPSESPGSKNKCGPPLLAISLGGEPVIVFEAYVGEEWDIRLTVMENIPPLCWITQPLEGEEVEGRLLIAGNATDPDGDDWRLMIEVRVVRLDGDHDSGWLRAEGAPTWNYTFDLTRVINGAYLIQARAGDGKSYSPIAEVDIVVSNAVQYFPDLGITPSNITFSSQKIEAGMTLAIYAEVWNTGNVNVTGVEVNFFRGDVQIGETRTISRIAAGDKGVTFMQWSALEGKHTIRVVVDPYNRILELNEGNNSASKQIDVKPAGYYIPDLEVSAANITYSPPSPLKGDVINMSITVWNHGRISVSSVDLLVLMNGEVLYRGEIDHVLEGSYRTVNITWTATVGEHTISVILDPDGMITDMDEENNEAELLLRVQVQEAFPGWYLGIAVALACAIAFLAVWIIRRGRR